MNKKLLSFNFLPIHIIIFFLSTPSIVLANHGPGTSGGGSSTQSAQTLKAGSFTFSVDEIYTNYESINQEQAEEIALTAEEFDAISDAFLTKLNFAYGVSDNLQLEASIGWYSGRNFIDAELEQEDSGEFETESSVADPEGLTDLQVRAKYRVYNGESGHLSVISGLVFPVGNDNELLSEGEVLEPSSQPGSGTFSIQGGLAYSRFLTPRLVFNASSLFTYRFERSDFKIGERFDNGMTFAYKIAQVPDVSLFAEISHLYIGQDQEDGEDNVNSGGHTLFLSPGLRVNITDAIGFSISPSFPVLQDLSGEQVEIDYRIQFQFFING